jgi:hypothetical protein
MTVLMPGIRTVFIHNITSPKFRAPVFRKSNRAARWGAHIGYISTITNGYAEVLWRQTLDQQTPGLSNALDFLQRASSFTSALQILGDPVLRAVVTTATGVPQQIAFQDIPAQEQAITSHLDIAKLQDPKFVQGLADLYLTNMAATAQQNAASGTGASLTSLAVQSQGLIA